MNKKYTIFLVIVVTVVMVDQWTKQLALHYLKIPTQTCEWCTKPHQECKAKCKNNINRNHSFLMCLKQCDVDQKTCRQTNQKSALMCNKDTHAKVKAWEKRLKSIEGSFSCRHSIRRYDHAECIVLKNWFGGKFNFSYKFITNKGAAWGIFSKYPASFRKPFFTTITFVALFFIFLISYNIEPSQRLMIISLSLILGGALGNFLDRLRMNEVIDFIKWVYVRSNGLHWEWPTFNVADIAISVGVGLIAIGMITEEDPYAPSTSSPNEKNNPPEGKAPTSSTTPFPELTKSIKQEYKLRQEGSLTQEQASSEDNASIESPQKDPTGTLKKEEIFPKK